jgi:hypothetical protein
MLGLSYLSSKSTVAVALGAIVTPLVTVRGSS